MEILEEEVLTGQNRWLLSYADLVTLLLALFVVLFVSARQQRKHVELPAIKPPVARNELSDIDRVLKHRLGSAVDHGTIQIHATKQNLVIELNDASFFPSGDDQIRPEAYPVIDEVARVVGPLPNLLAVEGHSDATAIHSSRFRDNWELSAARGLSVVRYLTHSLGIAQNRVSATAYADTRPRSDNDSEAGRAQNRRVDIVVFGTPAK